MVNMGKAAPCGGPETGAGSRLAGTRLGVSFRSAVSAVLVAGAAMLAAMLAAVTAPLFAGEEIGSTTMVVKKVTGEMAGEVRPLVVKDNVHQDEAIETSVSSASEIIFLDDTKITLGPNTRLKLDHFVFDPDPARGKFVLTTVKGVFRFVSGNLAKESYVIRTPTVTIGVRGTVFSVVTNEEGATAVILQCPVCGGYEWQPEAREQCLQGNTTSLTLESITGKTVTLEQCNKCTTFNPDGTLVDPAIYGTTDDCPDWASAALQGLDDLVGLAGQPGPGFDGDPEGDPGDITPGDITPGGITPGRDPDPDPDPVGDEFANRSGLGDGSNPGQGGGRANSPNAGGDNPGGSKR